MAARREPSKARFLRSPTVVLVRSILCKTKLFSVRNSKDLMILRVIVADVSERSDDSDMVCGQEVFAEKSI